MVLTAPAAWGSLAAAAAIAVVQRRRYGTHNHMVLIDAGSGSTRCVALGTRRCDDRVRVVAGPVRVAHRLGDALAAGTVDAWASDVAASVAALGQPRVPVAGAGTAGARAALKRTGEADLARAGRRVEAALRRDLPRASFHVFDGATEARLELAAARHAAPGAGLLSGGGKSVQVASSPDDALSLAMDSFPGVDLVLKRGARAGAAMHEWAARRAVANALGGERVRAYAGAFSLVELAAQTVLAAAEAAGRPPPVGASRGELVALLAAHRSGLVRALNPGEGADRAVAADPANAEAVRRLVYATQLVAVLELCFAPDATFSPLPPRAEGGAPAVNWALGLYLERRSP